VPHRLSISRGFTRRSRLSGSLLCRFGFLALWLIGICGDLRGRRTRLFLGALGAFTLAGVIRNVPPRTLEMYRRCRHQFVQPALALRATGARLVVDLLKDLTVCLALPALVFIDWHLNVQALQMDFSCVVIGLYGATWQSDKPTVPL